MATVRWAAIVGPLTSMTLAPCARAIATVSSVEPPSATMTSSAQRSDASAAGICHASLSGGTTTVRGSEAGGREGMGGARSGMTSSGCERSGLRLGCWSRGCPLIIQHAFRRHTVVMTTLLLAHDFPPEGMLYNQGTRSEEHTSELQSRLHLVCRLLLEKKKKVNETQ